MIPLAYVLVPLAPSVAAPIKPDATVETWNLRPGRDVAVYRHPRSTQATDRRLTLVFVHGGPGGYVRDFDRAFFSRFACDGFDVLLYDQAGAGRSPLLDAREYTHANNVEDLRAFVARIDTPVVLVGQSYGAALVTSALADPTTRRRVAHVVLSEPGKIPGAAFSADPLLAEKTTRAADAGRPPDLATAKGMMAPRAILAAILPPGQTLAPQEELINHYSPALQRELVRNSFCKGNDDLLASFRPTRFNVLANASIGRGVRDAAKPDLTTLPAPVMLLLGECSYIPRGRAMEYFNVYRIARSHVIDGVGHIPWGTRAGQDATHDAILRFIDRSPAALPDGPTAASAQTFAASGR